MLPLRISDSGTSWSCDMSGSASLGTTFYTSTQQPSSCVPHITLHYAQYAHASKQNRVINLRCTTAPPWRPFCPFACGGSNAR